MPSIFPPSIDRICPDLRPLQSETSTPTLIVKTNSIRALVEELLHPWPFDEEWYLTTYPDVAKAIRDKKFSSGLQHYIKFGYFEGRLPGNPDVDEGWYTKAYSDVAKGIEVGKFKSAAHHFIVFGYREGRIPREAKRAGRAPESRNAAKVELSSEKQQRR